MSSQEEYLDRLLNNIMSGGRAQPQEESADTAVGEMSGALTSGKMQGMSGMYDPPGMAGAQGMSGMYDPSGMAGAQGMSGMYDPSGVAGTQGASGMYDPPGMPEESDDHIIGTPVDDVDIAELLKNFGDFDISSEESASDSGEGTDISSMSEDDIERLLAQSRGMPEGSADIQAETFQGDVVDLLEGTEDSELREIQNLLEKSDNNVAVGGEIENLLQGEEQDSSEGLRAGTDLDNINGAEEQLSPKQQKAMEKKRIKEEKAAAKKAEREARKAEKAARKAAKKAAKGNDSAQGQENALTAETSVGAAAETGEPVDTAFLDSILSEAGKIEGAETVSSATGNYDAAVDNVIPGEIEETADTKNAEAVSSVNDSLGIDLNSLFGDSSDAESAMMADGTSELPDFAALSGDNASGNSELTEEEEETRPRKKGFFSRFLEFLTEEEEEEEENENIKLSEENKEIIEDLDKEKNAEAKKGKKGKKKVKKADASAGDGEEDEEGGADKKGKKKKAKKPKKEKLPKEEAPVDPGKKLSLKKVMPIVTICLSLVIAIIIIAYAYVNFADRKAASDAYYAGDYRTCYQNLYGKDMNETEQIMYGKSHSILTVRLWIREYEMLEAEGARLEALDSLIQSVNDYPMLYDYAAQWNAAGEVAQEYATILNLLYENYGLTEDQARAIAAESDDIEYTRQVNAIVQGGAYGSWNEPEPVVEAPLQDELPEEAELPEGSFIDTGASAQ